MIAALVKAFANLGDEALRRTLIAVALWTLGLYAVPLAALLVGLDAVDPGEWAARVGWLPGGLADVVAYVLGFLVFAALFWFTFAIVAQSVASFHLDRAVRRVEAIDYPGLPEAPGATFGAEIVAAARFAIALLAVNALALPFYVVGLFVPFASVGVFYLANGYLFGREYAEIVLLRRLSPAEAAAWRRENRGRLWVAGAIIALGMTIPVLNLLVPIVAAAFMTHLCHGRGLGAESRPTARRTAPTP